VSATAAGAPPRRAVGSFEIVREIGQGGMGVVYLAHQPTLDRMVVLKKIRRELLVDSGIVERFQREARSAAAVHHQNVVSIYDSFEARGDHYIAQEYVDGHDLRWIRTQLGRLDPEVAALIALEVARGLEEIHTRGIVHRDLKPANILIGASGDTKIADFGIAVVPKADGLTRPGILVGSIPYMAPEQVLGHRADHRTDVFLFGNLLYEMLAGSAPYLGPEDEPLESLLERMQKERYPDLRRVAPRTPRVLSRMIRNCLRAKPARRISSITQVRRILERTLGRPSSLDCRNEIAHHLWSRKVFSAADGQTAVRSAPRARARIASRRQIRWALAAAASSLLLVIAGVTVYAQYFRGNGSIGAPAAAIVVSASAPEVSSADAVPEPVAPALPAPPPPEPAHVRFVADPWAEVTIDGGSSFFTPRAAPVDLQPGSHRIVLAHPTLGRTELTLDLQPGESRTVRHVFRRENPS
jgi:serine/threonine protein kinase